MSTDAQNKLLSKYDLQLCDSHFFKCQIFQIQLVTSQEKNRNLQYALAQAYRKCMLLNIPPTRITKSANAALIRCTWTSPNAQNCGNLCKIKMAAACARTLGKVGWHILESPPCRAGNIASLIPRVPLHGSSRAYRTGGAGFRSKLLFSTPLRGGRVLGCAFLFGGGLGLYQTIKLSVQHHLAEEDVKVIILGKNIRCEKYFHYLPCIPEAK